MKTAFAPDTAAAFTEAARAFALANPALVYGLCVAAMAFFAAWAARHI